MVCPSTHPSIIMHHASARICGVAAARWLMRHGATGTAFAARRSYAVVRLVVWKEHFVMMII